MGSLLSFLGRPVGDGNSCDMFITTVSDDQAQFANPVIKQDFPDPNCIRINDTFYAFATNFGELQGVKGHIQSATSKDLVHWNLRPDALPNLPSWARPGKTWAPDITHVQADGIDAYVMYFVAWDEQTDLQGLAVATSMNPEGPYKCTAARPFMMQVTASYDEHPNLFACICMQMCMCIPVYVPLHRAMTAWYATCPVKSGLCKVSRPSMSACLTGSVLFKT